eukprot:7834061-Prorocentrum_lima.AAC.1
MGKLLLSAPLEYLLLGAAMVLLERCDRCRMPFLQTCNFQLPAHCDGVLLHVFAPGATDEA